MDYPNPFASLGQCVEDLASASPDDAAFRVAGRTFTRGDVAARARTLAAGWRAAGCAEGDIVGIVGEGGPAFVMALLSVARAGLVPLLLDPRLTAEETRSVFARAWPAALALCGSAPPPIGGTPPAFAFDVEGCSTLRTLAASADPPALSSDPHAAAVLIVTSGTSGHPRVVSLSAENLSSNIRAGYEAHVCARGAVFLSLLPATHAFELTNGLLGPLRCGATVVFPTSRNPRRLVETVIAEGVTHVNVVPALIQMVASELRDAPPEAAAVAGLLRRQLQSIVCGGAPMSPDLVQLMVSHGWPLWLGYGLTEASPSVAAGRADSLPAGSTGRALPGVEIRVDDTGELLVRGPNVMLEYVGEPDATAAALAGGWLRTGDLARIDARGRLFIVGRCRDLIVTSAGLKLSPDDIEAAYRSPLFAEVCAVGTPDVEGGGGERPHLAVVASPDSGADDAAVRAEFLRLSAAAGARRALAMTVVAAPLPRTRTLKLRRDLVKQTVVAGVR